MKQSMVSPLTGQLPLELLPPKTKSAAYRITISGDVKQKNMVICSVFDGLFSQCPAWSKYAGKSVAFTSERITLKNVPPQKKGKMPICFLFMSASTRCHHESTNQDLTVGAAFSGRAQNQVSYGGIGRY